MAASTTGLVVLLRARVASSARRRFERASPIAAMPLLERNLGRPRRARRGFRLRSGPR
jgi:hypothetical protein